MTAPVRAMLWELWRRWRWSLLVAWAYLFVAVIVAQLLPAILARSPWGIGALPDAGRHLAMPCAFGLIHLMAAFALVGGDDLKTNGYPSRMFVLPVRTRALVVWPMLWGCAIIACEWFIIAGLILRPTGNDVALWWPAAALTVGLALMQSLVWTPVAPSWVQPFIAVPAILALMGGSALFVVYGVREWVATCSLLVLLVMLYAMNRHGIAMARRGDSYDWGMWDRLVAWIGRVRTPAEHPFSSMGRAQFWFECRRFAAGLPIFVASLLLATAIVFLLQTPDGTLPRLMFADVVLLPVFLASFIGGQAGNASFPFLAIRPIGSVALVRSKFAMALASALASYVPVLLFLPLFFLRPDFIKSLIRAAHEAGPAKSAIVLISSAVLLVAFTWKGLVANLWIGLAGRGWLVNGLPVLAGVLLGVATLFGLWVWIHPEWWPFLRALVPWLVGLLLIAKLLTASWVVTGLLRSGLADPRRAITMVGTWTAVVAVLSVIIVWLVPGKYISLSGALAAIVLGIPFSRLAGAPLALGWNRHR